MALQLAIWLKSIAFFELYGRGKVMLFSVAAFPPEARLFDFAFHEITHVLIAIMALAFGKNIGKIGPLNFAEIILIAVVLHNFMYWLTASHPSAIYSILDFASDYVILGAFVIAGGLLARHPRIRQIKVPMLEG